jgi:hypothetical protein
MDFLLIVLEFFGTVAAIWAAICFVIFPLLRYVTVRIIHRIRCAFSKARFSGVGFLSFLFPHFFSGKPDYFMLSGKKLYAIKLKSYRKTRTKITVVSDKHWQIESIRQPHQDTGTFMSKVAGAVNKMMVHKRLYKAPTDLALYAKRINKALANEGIDCVPVLLINPSIKSMYTKDNLSLVDGDTVYYGVVLTNSFYPKNARKPDIPSKEASRIIKLAKSQLKTSIKRG